MNDAHRLRRPAATTRPSRSRLMALVRRGFEEGMDELERRIGPAAHLLRQQQAAVLSGLLATGVAGVLGGAVYLVQAIAGCATVLPLVPALLFLVMLAWVGSNARPMR